MLTLACCVLLQAGPRKQTPSKGRQDRMDCSPVPQFSTPTRSVHHCICQRPGRAGSGSGSSLDLIVFVMPCLALWHAFPLLPFGMPHAQAQEGERGGRRRGGRLHAGLRRLLRVKIPPKGEREESRAWHEQHDSICTGHSAYSNLMGAGNRRWSGFGERLRLKSRARSQVLRD